MVRSRPADPEGLKGDVPRATRLPGGSFFYVQDLVGGDIVQSLQDSRRPADFHDFGGSIGCQVRNVRVHGLKMHTQRWSSCDCTADLLTSRP